MAGDRGAYIDQSQSLNVHIGTLCGQAYINAFLRVEVRTQDRHVLFADTAQGQCHPVYCGSRGLAATRLKKKEKRAAAQNKIAMSAKQAQKAAWKTVDTTKGMSFEAAKRKAMQQKQAEEDSKVCLNCSS